MKINKYKNKFIMLIIGAIAVTLSGMNWHVGIAAWLAPIFLLRYTRNVQWKYFLVFFIVISFSGAISQTCNNFMHIPVVHIFNGISFGILYSIPFAIDKLLYKKSKGYYYSLIFPSAISIVEFMAHYAIGTWGSMAHTQYEFKTLMQIGSVTGIYTIWFLISWFASTANWVFENTNKKHAIYKGILIFGSVFILVLIYGQARLQSNNKSKAQVKVATVISESNIHEIVATEFKVFEKLAMDNSTEIPARIFSDSILINKLINRTFKAINKGAQIVVWNETALILNQNQKEEVLTNIKLACKNTQVYVLISFIEECLEKDKKPFNNICVLVSPSGKIEWEYKKSFLEYNAEAKIVNAGNSDLPVLQTAYGKIGAAICFDLDMQHYIKQAGQKAVDLLLVPSFDWPEITPLHSQMANIQAIQFGTAIVRANGNGVSAAYSNKGKELAKINTLNSDQKIMLADIPIMKIQTIYSQIGDVLILLCLVFLILIVLKTLSNK